MVTRTGSPIETVTADAKQRERLRFHTALPGLVLGEDQQGNLVSLRMFRPSPTRVFVTGTPRLTKIIGFRAIALGAALSIRTTHPKLWDVLLSHAAQERQAHGASPLSLTIVDGKQQASPATRPWSAELLMKPEVADWDTDDLGHSDIVLVQQVSRPQADLLVSALNLGQAAARRLSAIPPGSVAAISHGVAQHVRVRPTELETYLIGDPTPR